MDNQGDEVKRGTHGVLLKPQKWLILVGATLCSKRAGTGVDI